MLKRPVFNSFAEYWHYARYLSREQRKIIFKSLSADQKEFLDDSYLKEGWSDLFYRNEVNNKIDELKEDYGFDLLDIRIKALKGKSVYIPTKFWKVVEEQMEQYRPEVVEFVMSGMKAIPSEENSQVCLVIYETDDSD
ncbi:MAG TPA: hypothetical protein VMV95_03525 [Bacillota bacterium]|nr:hypothetical protein [Bacillota bacterium]